MHCVYEAAFESNRISILREQLKEAHMEIDMLKSFTLQLGSQHQSGTTRESCKKGSGHDAKTGSTMHPYRGKIQKEAVPTMYDLFC